MARKAIIRRELKRQKLYTKNKQKREGLIQSFKKATNLSDKFEIHKKLEKLPRNSSRVRLRNRCWRTGRGRGVYRDFGLCRHMIREMAQDCLLPGVVKSSW